VQYAIRRGRIPLTEDNRIDSDAADKAWVENTEEANARPGPKLVSQPRGGSPGEPLPTEPVPGMTFMQARALREVYEAQRRQLELEARRGELVKAGDVKQEAYRLFRVLRDACLNLPPRLAAQLAAETDEGNARQILEDELTRIFQTFSEGKLG
jgi:hypothetical protein